jgi:hypothetical protein
MIVCEDCRKTTSGKCWRHGQITPPTSFCDEILPCLIHRTEATDLPDRAVQPEARHALEIAKFHHREHQQITALQSWQECTGWPCRAVAEARAILPCLIHRTEATDLPDRAVQPDTPTMDQDARNALADATWLDRDGVNIEDAVKRLHRLGYTVVRAAAMTKEATR